jgi:hypothetical protein
MRPNGMVVVSLVGDVPWPETTVYADPCKRYDWAFLTGLPAAIVVRPGIHAEQTIRDVFEVTLPMRGGYPWLIDIERKQMASVIENNPIRLWHVMSGGETWRSWFQCT